MDIGLERKDFAWFCSWWAYWMDTEEKSVCYFFITATLLIFPSLQFRALSSSLLRCLIAILRQKLPALAWVKTRARSPLCPLVACTSFSLKKNPQIKTQRCKNDVNPVSNKQGSNVIRPPIAWWMAAEAGGEGKGSVFTVMRAAPKDRYRCELSSPWLQG